MIFHHVYTPTPFPYVLPFSHGSMPQIGPVLPSCFHFWKKALLFVWDSYIGSFIVTFPCAYVLYPELVHPLCFSYYLSPLLTVISTGFKILYSFLYRKYINHVHLRNFILLPSLSLVTSP
jgi:hypothetical protein